MIEKEIDKFLADKQENRKSRVRSGLWSTTDKRKHLTNSYSYYII